MNKNFNPYTKYSAEKIRWKFRFGVALVLSSCVFLLVIRFLVEFHCSNDCIVPMLVYSPMFLEHDLVLNDDLRVLFRATDCGACEVRFCKMMLWGSLFGSVSITDLVFTDDVTVSLILGSAALTH